MMQANMKSSRRIFTCIFIAILYFSESYGYTSTSTYEFGKDCRVYLQDIDEDDLVYVVYKGRDVSVYCNDISFSGIGDELLDQYEICVTPQEFVDPDCAVQLDYESSFKGRVLQSVTCSSNKSEKFCGPREDDLFIYFKKHDGNSTENARFRLLVEANKAFDYGAFVGGIAGGVLGGIVLVSVVTGLVCYYLYKNVYRRKSTQDCVLNPTVQAPMINQQERPSSSADYQQPPMNANPYRTATCSTSYSATYSMQSQPQPLPPDSVQESNSPTSAPPPSYDDLFL